MFLQVQSKDDLCYYNNKCKHDLLFIPAFNNVISNLLYVVYGLIFIVIVKLNNKKNTDGICQTELILVKIYIIVQFSIIL